ncbi:hypothetical protein NUW58_g10416 [Xylaria curta]|uniref:Uncharacterized protein n=1 Tax=Xylaria curta TaxID=42375 RepID=A0ACC1MML2_9PEZI|nr:hypothetical protein NUW58_g10416 [Xylaria curta]
MATATVTTTATMTTRRKKDANLAPENERFLRCCADIANVLIEDHEASKDPKNPRKDINLNAYPCVATHLCYVYADSHADSPR